MGLDRKLIQAAFLCGALVMPALTYGADPSAEDAFLARLSSDAIPRLQRELDAYLLSENFDRWYVEGVFDGTPLGPHAPIPGEDLVVTGQMFEQWQLSPFMPYYLEGTELPDCAAWLSDSCRWLPLTLTLSP